MQVDYIAESAKSREGVKKNIDPAMEMIFTNELAKSLNYVTKSKSTNIAVGNLHLMTAIERKLHLLNSIVFKQLYFNLSMFLETLHEDPLDFDEDEITKYAKLWLQKTSDRVKAEDAKTAKSAKKK